MKRYIFLVLLLASTVVAGCKKSEEQKNLDKANALLDKKGLPHIEKLDSVKDFRDHYMALVTASEYISKIDSINYTVKDRKYTKEEEREVSDLGAEATMWMAMQEELYKMNLEKGETPRFVGYKAELDNDERGLPVDYYFEKDLSAVKVIKWWKKRTDK